MFLNWIDRAANRLFGEHYHSLKKHSRSNYVAAIAEEATIVMNDRPGVWQVEYHASFWYAYASKHYSFNPGDVVRVIGREGIGLLIEKAE